MFLEGDFNCIDSLELDTAGDGYRVGDKGSVELKDFAQDWLLDQLSMSLDEQEQASSEGLLTLEECHEALNGVDTGKFLTAEFYTAFWAVLGSDLVEVLNYAFQHAQLSVSQHRGLLSLIFKERGKGP